MDARYWCKALLVLARRPHLIKEALRTGVNTDAMRADPIYVMTGFPEIADALVDIGRITWKTSNQDPLERYFLGAWCQTRRPRRIFEFGTYDGTTTLIMARNAPEAEIFTLDLPQDDATAAAHVTYELEHVQA